MTNLVRLQTTYNKIERVALSSSTYHSLTATTQLAALLFQADVLFRNHLGCKSDADCCPSNSEICNVMKPYYFANNAGVGELYDCNKTCDKGWVSVIGSDDTD